MKFKETFNNILDEYKLGQYKKTRSRTADKYYKEQETKNRQIAKWQEEDKKENDSTKYKFFDVEVGKGEKSDKSIYFLIQYQHLSKNGISTEFDLGDKESVKKIINMLEKQIRENG